MALADRARAVHALDEAVSSIRASPALDKDPLETSDEP